MRVAISGYYGFGNLGDEALLAGLLRQLDAIGVEPLVLSGDPEATSRLHGVAASHRYRGLPGALLGCQALISGGGGLLQDGTSARSLDYYLMVIRLARLLGKRAVVYGQSIGPLSETGRGKIKRALRDVPLAVRDQASIALLGQLGLQADLVTDPAMLLTAEPVPGVDVLLVPRGPHRGLSQALLAAGEEALSLGRSVGVLSMQKEEDDMESGFLLAGLPGAVAVDASQPQHAMDAVAAAGLVLSVRLHALIFAAAAGTPHAGLVYDPKVAGFLERSGGPAFEEPVDTVRLLGLVHGPPAVNHETLNELRAGLDHGRDWLRARLAA